MMNDKDKNKEFIKAEKEIRKALLLIKSDSIKDAIKLLTTAQNEIKVILKGTPTEWQVYHLSNTKSEIASVLKILQNRLGRIATTSSSRAWQNGIEMIDSPLAAAGMINVVHNLPLIDINRIGTNKAFMLERLTDIPASIVGKINAQLGMVSIGATSRHDAINNITKLLSKGGKSRAQTILGTELGRMQEIATHERRKEAQKLIPGMKKEWRKSGKIHSRFNHDKAHGQIVKINEKFTITSSKGTKVKLDHPRDPKAPAAETINCGCYTRTRFNNWEVKLEKQ